PEILCTVKLSRTLYPGVQGHSLDAICARIGYRRERAHRALDDVIATHAFVDYALREHGREALFAAALTQLRRPSQPAQLPDEEVSRIPNCPGVYRFYGENDALLYIGKSVRMRERVKSHFSADIRADREMRMAREVRHVDWVATAGELGALLRENLEIKTGSPIYNRRQRRHRQLWCFELGQSEGGLLQPQLTAKPLGASDAAMPGRAPQRGRLHGLFTSKGAASKWFAAAIDQHRLCKKMLGLERGAGSCFNYQLKRCAGICAGVESIDAYNLRVQAAFAENQLQVWPFEGAAAILEQAEDWRDAECAQRDIHLVDHWVYLGTVHDPADIPARLASLAGASFDRETYRILNRFIHLALPVGKLLHAADEILLDVADTFDANQP
ncbi:MAG: exonuclease domain-containing protein, partial [Pseudomonadales bacterium]